MSEQPNAVAPGSVMVTYPLRQETLKEMEARWKRGEPMATFSFTVTVISNGPSRPAN